MTINQELVKINLSQVGKTNFIFTIQSCYDGLHVFLSVSSSFGV
jgi:hypothetical protein